MAERAKRDKIVRWKCCFCYRTPPCWISPISYVTGMVTSSYPVALAGSEAGFTRQRSRVKPTKYFIRCAENATAFSELKNKKKRTHPPEWKLKTLVKNAPPSRSRLNSSKVSSDLLTLAGLPDWAGSSHKMANREHYSWAFRAALIVLNSVNSAPI